jgi:hypothetical protein
MNILIENNAVDYIRKHSIENAVTLFIKHGSGWH